MKPNLIHNKWIYEFSFSRILFFTGLLIIASPIMLQPSSAWPERQYIDTTCSETLSNLGPTATGTDNQGKHILQSGKGKWVKWTGTLVSMNETLWGMEVVVKCRESQNPEESQRAHATISFESSWKTQLQQLKAGEQIVFTGQVDDYTELGGFLIHAGELLTKEETRPASFSKAVQRILFVSEAPAHIGDEQIKDWPSLHGRCYLLDFVSTRCARKIRLELETYGLENSSSRLNGMFLNPLPSQVSKPGTSRPNYWSQRLFIDIPIQSVNVGMSNNLQICAEPVKNPEHDGDLDDFQVRNIKIVADEDCN